MTRIHEIANDIYTFKLKQLLKQTECTNTSDITVLLISKHKYVNQCNSISMLPQIYINIFSFAYLQFSEGVNIVGYNLFHLRGRGLCQRVEVVEND